MNNKNDNRGIIKIILIIIIIIVILSLLRINLRSIYENETVRANFKFVWEILLIVFDWLKFIWENYIKTPALFVWERLFIDIIWNTLYNTNISG